MRSQPKRNYDKEEKYMAVRNIKEARAEAEKRLKVLNVHENVLNEFKKGKLNRSEIAAG